MTVGDRWNDLTTLALHEGVPPGIRIHFDTARNLLLYAWFAYRFQQVAEMHAYSSLELALNVWARANAKEFLEKFEQASIKRKREVRPTLGPLLGEAVKQGWIRDEGFRGYQRVAENRAQYDEMLALVTGKKPEPEVVNAQRHANIICETIPYFRNSLAHGTQMAAPSGLRTLALCSDAIKQLFPAPRTNKHSTHDGAPSRG
jgi:hypothetical protein